MWLAQMPQRMPQMQLSTLAEWLDSNKQKERKRSFFIEKKLKKFSKSY
jgi:hypothetical protein